MHLTILWKNIESRLDADLPGWRKRIIEFGQVQAVKDRREKKKRWTDDDDVFEALLKAVISAGVNWKIIEERVLPDLGDFLRCELQPGSSFLESYSNLTEARLRKRWMNWFDERSAKPRWGWRPLIQLKEAARILASHSREYERAEDYFMRLMAQNGNDPKRVALCVGSPGAYKLPSLGVPLAAEALKNLGFDVAKPDRHVCRAMAAFRLVDFGRGKNGTYNYCNKGKQLETMTRVEEIAKAAGKPVAYIDNAIWLLGAQSGLRLKDKKLAELADNDQPQKDQIGLLALLESWMKEGDAEEQRETLEYLIRAMDENRPEGYKLFPPELKGKSW